MQVGVRALKAQLSEYLARAAAGQDVVVTDRGTPVARLVPYVAASEVERGIEEGWIEAPRRTALGPFEPVRASRSTAEVFDEDRG